MSDLTYTERGKLGRLFGMSSGFVLNFSNRSFSEFVAESVRRSIYQTVYTEGHSGSKANCLRAFWKIESNAATIYRSRRLRLPDGTYEDTDIDIQREWGPSTWGKRFTRSSEWLLRLDGDCLTLTADGRKFRAEVRGKSPVLIEHGVFWTAITFRLRDQTPYVVDGIPNVHGREIERAINAVLTEQQAAIDRAAEAERERDQLKRFRAALTPILQWHSQIRLVVEQHRSDRRWMTAETLQSMESSKPCPPVSPDEMGSLPDRRDIQFQLGRELKEAETAVAFWRADLTSAADGFNELHTQSELRACKRLFDTVESQPLTDEQARAVICFENRLLVVAAAGSGKTSTIVAKVAYAIKRGLVSPEKILLLAFNDSAARQLESRVGQALQRVGIPDAWVKAATFHKFGSDVIGLATGVRKRVAKWIDDGKEVEKLSEIVEALKKRSRAFRTRWDLFRIVFSRDIAKFESEPDHEDWDRATNQTGFNTLKGDVVKSDQERILCDWLYYNGVRYEYEKPYERNTATATHSQYRPDFYYPDMKLYHEHFALNRKGEAPKRFANYLEGAQWKREQHAANGTDFIETNSAQIWDGTAFSHLEREFEKRGIQLDPNPDRPMVGRPPIEQKELVKLFRGFICHAKSNCLSDDNLRQRVKEQSSDAFCFRHSLFLDMFGPIRDGWDSAIAEAEAIDFEDMLNQAAEHLEAGRWQSPYDLVMVDEFQDASYVRARMALALVKKPGRHLLAVGDDWQSINRFAGSDISVMTGFLDWCGHAKVLKLEQTFRCPQVLCDATSGFVMLNPKQIRKVVRSSTTQYGPGLQAFQVPDGNQIRGAIDIHLCDIHERVVTGSVPPSRDGKVSVFVLGRYRKDEQYVPLGWREDYGDRITLSFSTMHSSKGSEADYIILPGLTLKRFPSGKREDPVLTLAMSAEDPFPLAEERRLFYVAMTRARRSVAMFTVQGKVSPFLLELMADLRVTLMDAEGVSTNTTVCPKCSNGVMVKRQRRDGRGGFLSCTNFPQCRHSMNLAAVVEH